MKTILANATKFHPDRCSGVVLALLGVFLIYMASPLPIGTLKAPDSGFFPIILATLLILFGLGLLALSFVNEGFLLELTSRSWGVAICAACLIAYGLLIDRVGFLICTSAILIVLMRFYGGLKWRSCLMVTLPLVLVAYIGFKELGVPLPHGVLSFIW